tara:strand:+ start:733 stop:2082 length:1350 start_codon:yes stop_codon:yes gene_type:complete
MKYKIKKYLNTHVESSSLVLFRVLFGLQMMYSIFRFWSKGWIETIYNQPIFHFKYYGFSWVQSLGEYNYILFAVCFLTALFITIGYKYKLSIILFFLSFTYIELIDKTTYLNHYYFISILSFILIFLPANCRFSIDSIHKKISYAKIPKWNIDIIKIMLVLVYFFSGIAKINFDWLINSMPLSLWLPQKYDIPLIGSLLSEKWVAYSMSWCGMLFDVFIGFFLFSKSFRNYAYILVFIFHSLTAILFPSIGMFPYIMITLTVIFLDSKIHNSIIEKINSLFLFNQNTLKKRLTNNNKYVIAFLTLIMIIQLLFPLRHFLYDSKIFWSEEGYRFSWRVMLIEKTGQSSFIINDMKSEKRIVVDNTLFLTSFQESKMSFQPDMILEYAHFLGDHYKELGFINPKVTANIFVTLNGRLSSRFVKKDVNLLLFKDSFKKYNWITPFKDEIKNL